MKFRQYALPLSTTLLLASNADGSPLPQSHTLSKRYADVYEMYTGNGSPAEGWPLEDAWVPSFDTIFQLNAATLLISCAQFNAPNNSPEEVQGIYDAVVQVSGETGVDSRFIFAIMLQESTGCVRAPTTNGGVMNPGLMQDHNGTASCNTAGVLTTPCPQDTITQMIRDGVAGTPYGDGLMQMLTQSGVSDVQKYYMAARIYNSGSIAAGGDLEAGGSTHCYVSDIANRLTGWVHAVHACCLNTGCYEGATTYASTPATGWWSTATTAAIISASTSSSNVAAQTTDTSSDSSTQSSTLLSATSAVPTSATSTYTPGESGGIFAPTSETFSATQSSTVSTTESTQGISASTSQSLSFSSPSSAFIASISGSLAPSANSTVSTTSVASISGGLAPSANSTASTASDLVTTTPAGPSISGATTYVLTLGTQTVTYTVNPNDIYWATVLSPYVYWAATSTPAPVAARTLSESEFTLIEATPTARASAGAVHDKRASYDVSFTTLLVDVPVNVPVPFETRTITRSATVTATKFVTEYRSRPNASPSSSTA